MNKFVCVSMILLTISAGVGLYGRVPGNSESFLIIPAAKDTIKEKQILYNGTFWKNLYHRIKGDQFLFSDYFLPGTISINGQTFKNLKIRYDIYSDEIMIPVNLEEILQVNKEMVDSFTINSENKDYRFIRVEDEALKDIKGYINVLYIGKSALYVKYKKDISLALTETTDGEFFQNDQIYFVKDNVVYPINGRNDLLKLLDKDKVRIRDFISKNRIKISKKVPESFIPVIRFYDSLDQ